MIIIITIISGLASGVAGFLAGCMWMDSSRADEMAAEELLTLEQVVALHRSPNVVSLDYYRAHHPQRAAS